MNLLDTKVALLGMPRRQRLARFLDGVGTIVFSNHLRAFTGRLFKKG